MRIFRGFDQLPHFRHAVATVGSYDGVHTGHRALINRIRREADAIGGESVLFTFEPHPRLALDPACDMKLLTPLDEKCHLLESAGVNNLVIIPFDYRFSRTTPEEFVRLLVEKAHIECLVIGYDHHFGRDKQGSIDLLRQMDLLRVIEIPELEMGANNHLSSTVIRRIISDEGDMDKAAKYLGHPYILTLYRNGEQWVADPRKLQPKAGKIYVGLGSDQNMYIITIRDDGTISLSSQPTADELRFMLLGGTKTT